MRISTKVSPINSLIFISDLDGGKAPYPVRGAMIMSTSSCISVGCHPEQDGPTEIVLGKLDEVDPGAAAAFDGDLDTPNGHITISTVDRKTILDAAVPEKRTHVRIWLSHPRWPERVIIGCE
jgi:hypothetical protein